MLSIRKEKNMNEAIASLETLIDVSLNSEEAINQFTSAWMNSSILRTAQELKDPYEEELRNSIRSDLIKELNMPTRFFIQRNIPNLISKGTNQFVFSLEGGYVVKIKACGWTKDFYLFSSKGENCYYPEGENYRILSEIGIDTLKHFHYDLELEKRGGVIPVQIPCNLGKYEGIMVGVRDKLIAKVRRRKGCLTIAEDARWNGYNLMEANQINFEKLSNTQSLLAQYTEWKAKLLSISQGQNASYGLQVLGHAEFESKPPLEAIEHMFGISYKGDVGKIILFDLDHVRLYRKGETK
jgi:hypothetical protein